jgi:hypothetical protein
MDSAVLGLASPVMVDVKGTMFGFEHNFALEDCTAYLLEASLRATNGIDGIPLGSPLSYWLTLYIMSQH